MKISVKIQIALLIILGAAFIFITVMVLNGLAQNVNEGIYNIIALSISPALTALMKIISNIGEWFVYIPFALFFLIVPGLRIRIGIPAALSLAVAAGLNSVLKMIFRVDRPELHRLITETGYGYPSGHAMIGTAFIGVCAYLFYKYTHKKPAKIAVIVIACLFLFLIGYSRIYLGVHYPTDVIAGYLCGAMIITICTLVINSKVTGRLTAL